MSAVRRFANGNIPPSFVCTVLQSFSTYFGPSLKSEWNADGKQFVERFFCKKIKTLADRFGFARHVDRGRFLTNTLGLKFLHPVPELL
jgi:hypothetical protein